MFIRGRSGTGSLESEVELMKIRHASEDDVRRVIELWIAMMDLHRDIDTVFTRRKDGHVAFEAFLRENIEWEDAAVIVAEDDGRVVGYIMARIQKSPPVLLRMFANSWGTSVSR